LRKDPNSDENIIIALNFTPIPRYNFRVGVPTGGEWKEIFNSDAKEYSGSGHGNFGEVKASPIPFHGRPYSLNLVLPPLGAVYLKKA
jgi:1,4-alpha-glucan branching enzyme